METSLQASRPFPSREGLSSEALAKDVPRVSDSYTSHSRSCPSRYSSGLFVCLVCFVVTQLSFQGQTTSPEFTCMILRRVETCNIAFPATFPPRLERGCSSPPLRRRRHTPEEVRRTSFRLLRWRVRRRVQFQPSSIVHPRSSIWKHSIAKSTARSSR